MTKKVITFIRQQQKIRVYINYGGGFGDQISALHTIERLKQLGFKGTFDVIYHPLAAIKLANLFNLPTLKGNKIINLPKENITLTPDDIFFQNIEKAETLSLGILAATGSFPSSLNLAEKFKTKIFFQTNPYLDDPNETNILHFNNRSRPYKFPHNFDRVAIHYPVPTLEKAKHYLKTTDTGNSILEKKPGLMSIIEKRQKEQVQTVSLYGLNVIFHTKPSEVVSRYISALKIVYQKKPKLFKGPTLILAHNELSKLDLEKIVGQQKIRGDFKIIDLKDPSFDATISAGRPDQIFFVYLGNLPYQAFDAIFTHSTFPALQEGANSATLLLNAKQPFIHCRPYKRARWPYIIGEKTPEKIANQLSILGQYTCPSSNMTTDPLADYILALNTPKSKMHYFWKKTFNKYHNPKNSRLLQGLTVALSDAKNKNCQAFPDAIRENSIEEVTTLSRHCDISNLLYSQHLRQETTPLSIAFCQNKFELVEIMQKENPDTPQPVLSDNCSNRFNFLFHKKNRDRYQSQIVQTFMTMRDHLLKQKNITPETLDKESFQTAIALGLPKINNKDFVEKLNALKIIKNVCVYLTVAIKHDNVAFLRLLQNEFQCHFNEKHVERALNANSLSALDLILPATNPNKLAFYHFDHLFSWNLAEKNDQALKLLWKHLRYFDFEPPFVASILHSDFPHFALSLLEKDPSLCDPALISSTVSKNNFKNGAMVRGIITACGFSYQTKMPVSLGRLGTSQALLMHAPGAYDFNILEQYTASLNQSTCQALLGDGAMMENLKEFYFSGELGTETVESIAAACHLKISEDPLNEPILIEPKPTFWQNNINNFIAGFQFGILNRAIERTARFAGIKAEQVNLILPALCVLLSNSDNKTSALVFMIGTHVLLKKIPKIKLAFFILHTLWEDASELNPTSITSWTTFISQATLKLLISSLGFSIGAKITDTVIDNGFSTGANTIIKHTATLKNSVIRFFGCKKTSDKQHQAKLPQKPNAPSSIMI